MPRKISRRLRRIGNSVCATLLTHARRVISLGQGRSSWAEQSLAIKSSGMHSTQCPLFRADATVESRPPLPLPEVSFALHCWLQLSAPVHQPHAKHHMLQFLACGGHWGVFQSIYVLITQRCCTPSGSELQTCLCSQVFLLQLSHV